MQVILFEFMSERIKILQIQKSEYIFFSGKCIQIQNKLSKEGWVLLITTKS